MFLLWCRVTASARENADYKVVSLTKLDLKIGKVNQATGTRQSNACQGFSWLTPQPFTPVQSLAEGALYFMNAADGNNSSHSASLFTTNWVRTSIVSHSPPERASRCAHGSVHVYNHSTEMALKFRQLPQTHCSSMSFKRVSRQRLGMQVTGVFL